MCPRSLLQVQRQALPFPRSRWTLTGEQGGQTLGASVGLRRRSLLRYVLGLCGGECI